EDDPKRLAAVLREEDVASRRMEMTQEHTTRVLWIDRGDEERPLRGQIVRFAGERLAAVVRAVETAADGIVRFAAHVDPLHAGRRDLQREEVQILEPLRLELLPRAVRGAAPETRLPVGCAGDGPQRLAARLRRQ